MSVRKSVSVSTLSFAEVFSSARSSFRKADQFSSTISYLLNLLVLQRKRGTSINTFHHDIYSSLLPLTLLRSLSPACKTYSCLTSTPSPMEQESRHLSLTLKQQKGTTRAFLYLELKILESNWLGNGLNTSSLETLLRPSYFVASIFKARYPLGIVKARLPKLYSNRSFDRRWLLENNLHSSATTIPVKSHSSSQKWHQHFENIGPNVPSI